MIILANILKAYSAQIDSSSVISEFISGTNLYKSQGNVIGLSYLYFQNFSDDTPFYDVLEINNSEYALIEGIIIPDRMITIEIGPNEEKLIILRTGQLMFEIKN